MKFRSSLIASEGMIFIMTQVATLIGDLIGSRTSAERGRLHDAFAGAVARANEELDPVTPLRITVGDEFQGCFATVGAALQAAFRIRLWLRDDADLRQGVGWGSVTVLSDDPLVEDGPGWWSARDAIEAVEAAESRAASRSLHTAYRLPKNAEAGDGPDPAAVNAALMARDQLVAAAGEQGLSVVAGMLSGMSQQEIARDLGVSPSAVSQRVRRDGLATIVRVDELLGETT